MAWSLFNKFKIEVARDPTPSDDMVLRQRIWKYNASHIGSRPVHFSVFVRGAKGDICGGATVYAHPHAVYVDTLWVDEALQRKGLGRRVMEAVEEEARRRKIPQVILDTFSFQAEPFYRKLGYELMGTIPNYMAEFDRVFLKKDLSKQSDSKASHS
jgi:ribosomal protein S18 acetylase RimI-like enzyme